MAWITLSQAKKHLNIEDDFTEDDSYIEGLCAVAEQAVRVHVNEDLDGLAEENGGELPSPLIQSMLLMVGNMYMNREPIGTKGTELPFNYRYLIDLYRNYNN